MLFVLVSQFLDFCCCFFSVFFSSLVFSVSHFYWVIVLLREYFLSHVQSVDKPIKDILHFCYSAFDPLRSFWSLWEFPALCLHCPALLACSTLSFWALSFLIIILVLNSQANSNISAVSESLLTLDLSLQTYVFPFSVSCTFFLLAWHDVVGTRNCCRWQGVGRGKVFCGLTVVLSLSEPVALGCRFHECFKFFPLFDGTGGLEWARVGCFLFSQISLVLIKPCHIRLVK